MGLTADAYAWLTMQLLPPGKLWRAVASELLELFLGCADELVRLDARIDDLLRESVPSTAVELLPDYERELGLVSTGTMDERRARVVARLVRRQRYRPVDFQAALAPLLVLDPGQVAVIQRTRAFCVAIGDDREIYRFFVYRDPALGAFSVIDPGEAGNQGFEVITTHGVWPVEMRARSGTTIAISFVDNANFTAATVEVHDGQRWTGSAWVAEPSTCGVLVTGNDTRAIVLVSLIEAAINGASQLVQVTPNPSDDPANSVVMADMGSSNEIAVFPPGTATYFLASAQELLDSMAASHTRGHVIESINFLCDDPFSLCDRDLLGA